MIRSAKFWPLALASGHLFLLVSGMKGITGISPAWLSRTRHVYELVTGAGGGWGFFSPSVSQQLMIRFEVHQPDTATRRLALEELAPHEVAIRLGNMARFFSYSYRNERLRRAVAASLAARVFDRFPAAKEVTLIGTAYQLPSLSEYRRGNRARAREVYRIKFRSAEGRQ